MVISRSLTTFRHAYYCSCDYCSSSYYRCSFGEIIVPADIVVVDNDDSADISVMFDAIVGDFIYSCCC